MKGVLEKSNGWLEDYLFFFWDDHKICDDASGLFKRSCSNDLRKCFVFEISYILYV